MIRDRKARAEKMGKMLKSGRIKNILISLIRVWLSDGIVEGWKKFYYLIEKKNGKIENVVV